MPDKKGRQALLGSSSSTQARERKDPNMTHKVLVVLLSISAYSVWGKDTLLRITFNKFNHMLII